MKLIGEKINHPLAVLSLLVHVGVIAGIVVLQHDLGSALVYLFIAVFMCFSAGLSSMVFCRRRGAVSCRISAYMAVSNGISKAKNHRRTESGA